MIISDTKNIFKNASAKRTSLKYVLIATVLASSVAVATNLYAGNKDTVVATYSGGEVKESDVLNHLKNFLGDNAEKNYNSLGAEEKKSLVTEYVTSKLVDEEVKKQNIVDSEEYKKQMSRAGEQIARKVLIDKYIATVVTDQAITKEYEKFAKEMKGQKEVNTKHILVADEATAKDIKKKLDKGEKFADLAKKFSKDESSKVKGGEIGYTVRGTLVPEYESKAFSMKAGQVSDPVKSQFGWHIIELIDIRDAKIPSKEDAAPSIRQKMTMDAVQKYLHDLNTNAKLELKI